MSTHEAGEASHIKRCARCQTEKHRSEFTTQGYCRPCSRAYARERAAKKTSQAPAEASAPRVTSIKDLADRVATRSKPAPQAPRGTAPARTPAVGAAAAQRIDAAAALTDRLACAVARLADVLEDGEMISLTVTRIGPVLVLRDVHTTVTRAAG